MQPARAQREFERFLVSRRQRIESLSVPEGIDAMLAFYRDVRAEGVTESDGDMLLYQWGTYDWGEGSHFELDITRQLMFGAGEDEDIWQLSLTFLFTPSPEFVAVSAGQRWCHSLDERDALDAFIRSSAAYAAATDARPLRVELDHGCAG